MAVYGLAAKRMPLVVGIDEVGRGALAGPVVVAAAVVPHGLRLKGLKDSKKLSARQRELWCARFAANPEIMFVVARVYPRQIEKRNISQAANLAAQRVIKKLLKGDKKFSTPIFLDGGLYIGNKKWQAKNTAANTMVKADEIIGAVMVASIIAKVHRDRFMKKLAKRYPNYGFDIHKGYGTKIHRDAIARHGASAVHRLTFLKKSSTIYK
jgi:ribonuclease HII